MQLFALDEGDKVVPAAAAEKQRDYRCFECGGAVRVRRGYRRHPHFYHPSPERACRQHEKGILHIQVQERLSNLIPSLLLEERFPQIGRVADAFWPEEKLVFEVQCSPITPEEAAERNEDYSLLGLQVVWIFHDSRYNKRRPASVELAIEAPHFFTNINAYGEGIIYDQLAFLSPHSRCRLSPLLAVDLAAPRPLPLLPFNAPALLKERKLHFKGDLFTYFFANPKAAALTRLKRMERRRWLRFLEPIARPYRILFRILLESACR